VAKNQNSNFNTKNIDTKDFIAKEFNSIDFPEFVEEFLKDSTKFTILYTERGYCVEIYSDKSSVSFRKIDSNTNSEISEAHDNPTLRTNRNYIIKAGEADDLLKEIGIMTKDGKIRNDMIRKYNQIDRFVELIDEMLKTIIVNKESITILDCACGKSYLSFVLNYYIKEKLKTNCNFVCLDINENVIDSSKKMADSLAYRNMEFLALDIKNYSPKRDIDVVISLHGCDIATDLALAAGVRFGSDLIVVIPCCQKELLSQIENEALDSIFKHGILKARFNDLLTDSVRALILEAKGYETSIVEYISPLDTPKNLMIRAIKNKRLTNKNELLSNRNIALEKYKVISESFKITPSLARFLRL